MSNYYSIWKEHNVISISSKVSAAPAAILVYFCEHNADVMLELTQMLRKHIHSFRSINILFILQRSADRSNFRSSLILVFSRSQQVGATMTNGWMFAHEILPPLMFLL